MIHRITRFLLRIWSRVELTICRHVGHDVADNASRTYCVQCGWFFNWNK